MSSSDYTAMQKLRALYTVNYNTLPSCAQNTYTHQHVAPIHVDPHTLTNYYAPHGNFDYSGRYSHPVVHSHDPHGSHLHYSQPTHVFDLSSGSHVSKTIRKYEISPVADRSVNFSIGKNNIFNVDNFVFVSNVDASNNYFKGTVSSYDKFSGEISISKISNISGTFTTASFYQVSVIFENPDLFKLEERINNLYDYLFNVNLESTPAYSLSVSNLSDNEQFIYNLYIYLFNTNIRDYTTYTLSDTYLSGLVNDLYSNFFDLDLTLVHHQDNNPNGNNVPLNTLQNKTYQIYLYFFEIDLATNSNFNPNIN